MEAKVGAFVLACLAVLTFTLIYLFNAHFRGGEVPYRTYLQYAGGLEPGDDVLFGGIRSGKITSVRPSREDPTKIEILLQLKAGTPVNEKSVAKLGSLSIMSDPALAISTGSSSAPRLTPGGNIPSAEAVSLDDMAAKLATIADNANALIGQVQGELGGISSSAQKLLANLNSITGPADQEQIQVLLQQANGLLATERPKIEHTTDQLLALTQHADAMIGKTGPVIDHADGAIQSLNAIRHRSACRAAACCSSHLASSRAFLISPATRNHPLASGRRERRQQAVALPAPWKEKFDSTPRSNRREKGNMKRRLAALFIAISLSTLAVGCLGKVKYPTY